MCIEEDYLIHIPDNNTDFSPEVESMLRTGLTTKIENVFYRPSFRKYTITAVLDDLPTTFAVHRLEILADLFAYSKLIQSAGFLNSEETNPIEQEFVVYDTSLQIVSMIRTERIKSYGVSAGLYTGIREGVILPGTLFEAVKIMCLIDFGNEEYESFQIFKPVFDTMRQNINALYEDYKEKKESEEKQNKKRNEQKEPEEDSQKANRKVNKKSTKEEEDNPAKTAGKLVPTKTQLAKVKDAG